MLANPLWCWNSPGQVQRDAIWSTETPPVLRASRRRGVIAARGTRATVSKVADHWRFWAGYSFGLEPVIASFVQRLHELGWIEGRTIGIEYRWADGRSERFAEIASEFVRLRVDVILTGRSPVPTLKQATWVSRS